MRHRAVSWRQQGFLVINSAETENQLNQISHAIIISRLRYVLPIWSGFLSTDLINRIQSILKRLFKFSYTTNLISFQDLINSCSVDLFQCMNPAIVFIICYLVMSHVQIGYVLVGILCVKKTVPLFYGL